MSLIKDNKIEGPVEFWVEVTDFVEDNSAPKEVIVTDPLGDDATRLLQPLGTCKECGCTTGGGEYCYRHAPYTVHPLKDGSFRSTRNGLTHIWFDEPPSPLSESEEVRALLEERTRLTEAQQASAQLRSLIQQWRAVSQFPANQDNAPALEAMAQTLDRCADAVEALLPAVAPQEPLDRK